MIESLLFIVMLMLAGVFAILIRYNLIYTECDKNYTSLQQKYENDTKPLQLQIADFKKRAFEAEDKASVLATSTEENLRRIELLEKNIIGKFDKEPLVSATAKTCVSIADDTKGDFSYLKLNTLCSNPEKVNIFTYDPVYKQVIVKLGEQKRCVDAINKNDVVLNECLRTSQKQKFNYFPLSGGRFKSMLYNNCLGFNAENNIIELQKCNELSNIMTQKNRQQSHLLLENN